jgi:hypothetical protein
MTHGQHPEHARLDETPYNVKPIQRPNDTIKPFANKTQPRYVQRLLVMTISIRLVSAKKTANGLRPHRFRRHLNVTRMTFSARKPCLAPRQQ